MFCSFHHQFLGLIAGLIYLNQGSSGQDSIRNLNGVLFFVTSTMTFNAMTGSLFVSYYLYCCLTSKASSGDLKMYIHVL